MSGHPRNLAYRTARAHTRRLSALVEDLDPPREIPGAADGQLRTLERFGLVPDGTVLRQSDRDAHYREALERLLAGGDAFECHCSRSDLAGSGGVHRACVPGARRPYPAIRLQLGSAHV